MSPNTTQSWTPIGGLLIGGSAAVLIFIPCLLWIVRWDARQEEGYQEVMRQRNGEREEV